MKTIKFSTRHSGSAAFAPAVAAASLGCALMFASAARAATDCPTSMTLADWGESSTGYINVAPGGSCQFPLTMHGTVNSSDISQKPDHGKLKRLNPSTYEYRAKRRYTGSDTFAIKATGQGPTTSGTSVITVHATVK